MPLPLFLALVNAAEATITCGLRYEISEDLDITINGCIFSDLRFPGSGGAINLNSSSITASINFTSFQNCSATEVTSSGGAIYCIGKNLHLFSVCGTYCSSYCGALFFFSAPDISNYMLDSVSSEGCYLIENGILGIICMPNAIKFNYVNISDTLDQAIRLVLYGKDTSSLTSCFITLANLFCKNALVYLPSTNPFSIEESNIVGNEVIYFCTTVFNSGSITVRSCVFAQNTIKNLICLDHTVPYSCAIVFENCWMDQSQGEATSANITFRCCNFTLTSTLSFFDRNIISDGVSCGIGLPSPSQSIPLPTAYSPSQSPLPSTVIPRTHLSNAAISSIVVGSVTAFGFFGCLIWFFTRKAAWRKYRPDAEAITLLRNLETSYG